MKNIKMYYLGFLFLCFLQFSFAQNSAQDEKKIGLDYQKNKNILKVNLPAISLKNISLQYERVVSKRSSFALGVGFTPSGSLPFSGELEKAASDDSPELVTNAKMSYFSITPEYRFYVGKKGYGKGFYFAPYYRYSSYNLKGVKFNYEDDSSGINIEKELELEGDVSAHSFGIMFGASFNLSKRLVLDWWIVGAHYGTASGKLSGYTNTPLNSDEQKVLNTSLENDLSIPVVDSKITTNSNGAVMDFSGPWAGLRSGISLGYRF